MARAIRRVPVPFEADGTGDGTGDGDGVEELTWGQLGIWQTMARTGRTMNIGGTMAVPPGTTVEQLAGLLAFIVGRHEALRTRLTTHPDRPPRQVVAPRGEVVLEVVDSDPDQDLDAVAEQLRSRYEFTPFDHAHEWPVRMGAVCRGGAITHVVVQYCHLAVDGFGIDAAVRDLAHLDPATGRGTVPVTGLTPRQLAQWQHGPAGARQTERALRYWGNLLRQIPAQRLDIGADPSTPRFWDLIYRSAALHLAATAVAHRTRAALSHVLLAAYSVALARYTGRSPSVAQVLVSNRFRPGCADSVSHLTQPSLCAIDVADSTFDEVVGRAWKASTTASMFGYFDTVAHNALLARIAGERGELDISCFVNDRRGQSGGPQPLGPMPTPREVAQAPPSTSWWDRKLDTYDATLYVTFDSAPQAVDISIVADTHYLAPAQIEALARSIEAVVVEAAFDGSAATGVPTPVAAERS